MLTKDLLVQCRTDGGSLRRLIVSLRCLIRRLRRLAGGLRRPAGREPAAYDPYVAKSLNQAVEAEQRVIVRDWW